MYISLSRELQKTNCTSTLVTVHAITDFLRRTRWNDWQGTIVLITATYSIDVCQYDLFSNLQFRKFLVTFWALKHLAVFHTESEASEILFCTYRYTQVNWLTFSSYHCFHFDIVLRYSWNSLHHSLYTAWKAFTFCGLWQLTEMKNAGLFQHFFIQRRFHSKTTDLYRRKLDDWLATACLDSNRTDQNLDWRSEASFGALFSYLQQSKRLWPKVIHARGHLFPSKPFSIAFYSFSRITGNDMRQRQR